MSTRRASALALSITAVLSGLLLLWAVLAAPEQVRSPLAWGGGLAAVLLTAAVTAATYAGGQVRALRDALARRDDDARRFAHETVPGLVGRLRSGESTGTALAETTRSLGEAADDNARALLTALATEVGRGEASRAAAMSACANAAGRMQALSTSMLADLREMEHRHADEDVLADLLHLDHRTAQAGRLADSIAILTGARSGRRWAKPIVMESVLRGAMGRINGYQRVRLHSTSQTAVAGHAAEGVMHALAELLDNAANFSPPTAEVHVYVEEVPAGLIITVEDSGLVMSDVQLRRAERAVSSSEPLDLTGLSGTRLGLAVVGCLARKHGLKVSFRPSARGGTGALMLLPQELLTQQPQPGTPAPRHDTGSTRLPAPTTGAGREHAAPAPLPAAPVREDLPPVREDRGHFAVRDDRDHGLPAVRDGLASPAARDDLALPVRDREALPDHARAEQPPAPRAALPAETRAGARAALPAESSGSASTEPPAPRTTASDTTGNLPRFGDSGLPQRRRGRTLAAAHPQGPDAPARPASRPAERRAATNRFSTFRKAVQGQDQDAPQDPAPKTPRSTAPHPEGNDNR
ncbi:ATP-binding protein [Streptomyces sp. CA-294286]|uniref:sensor histidine kinase n=1 Tax=Streptomyces sp. CA-294286 TaxID=3240070 RepID=UPI003D8A1561